MCKDATSRGSSLIVEVTSQGGAVQQFLSRLENANGVVKGLYRVRARSKAPAAFNGAAVGVISTGKAINATLSGAVIDSHPIVGAFVPINEHDQSVCLDPGGDLYFGWHDPTAAVSAVVFYLTWIGDDDVA